MHMMQLYLVEERDLPSDRMAQHSAAALAHAQIVLTVPFGDEGLLLACFLNHRAILCLEESLPVHIESIRKITDIHQSQIFEFLSHRRIQLLVNFAAVHDRRTATFFGRDHTEEADPCWPGIHVRALVVVKDSLVFGIRGGSVNLPSYAFAWQIAIFGVDLVVDRNRYSLEVLRCGQCEAAEQDSAVLVELGIYVVAVIPR